MQRVQYITLIRHGEAEHNVTQDPGQFDPPLTSYGIKQCLLLRSQQVNSDVQLILSSTSKRTLDTAIYAFPGKKVYASDLFIECNSGDLCNTPQDRGTLQGLYPQVDFDTYGVEKLATEASLSDVTRRARRILHMLQNIEYDKIVLVTHQHTICAILTALVLKRHLLDNCGDITVAIPRLGVTY